MINIAAISFALVMTILSIFSVKHWYEKGVLAEVLKKAYKMFGYMLVFLFVFIIFYAIFAAIFGIKVG